MNAPEVSVVLAVRDDADGLESAARSVLAQREVDLELIAVDDGSDERTAATLRSLASGDVRVRPLASNRQGLTAALILGCAEARAELVARHDAGDLSDPSRLRRQVDLLRANADVALVSCWTRCLGPEGEELQLVTGRRNDESKVELDPSDAPEGELVGPSSHGSVVFRKSDYEASGGYRREFSLAQDWDLWWRLGERGLFAAVPRVLYTRTLDPRSLSLRLGATQHRFGRLAQEAARARRRGQAEEPALRQVRALAHGLIEGRRAADSEARGLYFIASLLRARGDRRAKRYFRAATRSDALFLRAWVRWLQCLI